MIAAGSPPSIPYRLRRVAFRNSVCPHLLCLVLMTAVTQPLRAQSSPDVGPLKNQPFVRMTGDVLGYELVPQYRGSYKRVSFETNRWGMRDQDYELRAPRGTYRIALVGSSFSMGAGVPQAQTHEALLETRLNSAGPGVPGRRYEILNFAVGGYGILQNVAVVDRKVFPFEPDAVLLMIHGNERTRMLTYLSELVRARVPIRYPFVEVRLRERDVAGEMEEVELRRRLGPVVSDLVRDSYRQIARDCARHRTPIVGVVFPVPRESDSDLREVAGLARGAGIPLISLEGVYDGYDLSSVTLGGDERRDRHLNALGHRLVANRVYELLLANDRNLLKLGFAHAP